MCPPRPIHHSAGAKKQDNCQRCFCVVWDKPGGLFCLIGSRPNRARRGPGKLSHFPVRKPPAPPFRALLWESSGRARAGTLSRFALGKSCARLSRFALGKSAGGASPLCSGKGPGGAHFPALLWRSPVAGFRTLLWESRRAALRRFALAKSQQCGRLSHFALAKSDGRGRLSRFALKKSAGPCFPALLWRSRRARGLSHFALAKRPPGHTFPLCSGEVARRALSRFALKKCVFCDKAARRFRYPGGLCISAATRRRPRPTLA